MTRSAQWMQSKEKEEDGGGGGGGREDLNLEWNIWSKKREARWDIEDG